MKSTQATIVEWFLRLSLSAGLLSAVADRFGLWGAERSAWGDWGSFLAYTQQINPWVPAFLIPALGAVVTVLEVALGIMLLIIYRTDLIAKATGVLLLLFALAMATSSSIKSPLDASVFSASAAAFALSLLAGKEDARAAARQ